MACYFLNNAWRVEVFKGIGLREINRELIAMGILIPGAVREVAQSINLPEIPKARTYVADVSRLLVDDPVMQAAA